jgi:two-component system, NtrC family, response regulator AtoC
MNTNAKLLVVDDDPTMCTMLRLHLKKRGYDVVTHTSAGEAFDALRADDFDAVVTDLNMRAINGLELCERVVADRPDVPVLMITAFGSLDTSIAAIRAGAYDFIPKPFEIDSLVVALERAVQHRTLREEVKRLREAAEAPRGFGPLLGDSAPMCRVYDVLERIKDSSASVLITGESGTGKELVARTLHERGPRREGPFVSIHCAALPEELLERELFGQASGTDGSEARDGLFVQANGGTILLDEIGEMPLGLQSKILRAVQEKLVRPLGAEAEVAFDARICATTNRDLETAVQEGRFRGDLYYRLNVIPIQLPPLRARGNDVLPLAAHFLKQRATLGGKRIRGISPAAAQRLLAYAWPGNVRELQNYVERAVAFAQYEEIVVEDLPEAVRDYRRPHLVLEGDDAAPLLSMEEVERRYIEHVLERTNGNKTLAARTLGFDRTTLYRKLERYGWMTSSSGSGGGTSESA